MDPTTLSFYDRNADGLAESYLSVEGGLSIYFPEAFPGKGSRILDIGSASGRDMLALLKMGHDAFGMEPSENLRRTAAKNPHLEGRILPHGLPLPRTEQLSGKYDGILCSATLMHIPEEELFDAAFDMKRLLREGGRLLISVPDKRPNLDEDHRDEKGRLFTDLPVGYVLLLFERLGFKKLRRWNTADSLGREGIRWNTFLFELRRSNEVRPLDRVEIVLNRDTKTATYKLALFRSLSEIGTKEYRWARWIGETEVGVPIERVAEKWLKYYWPIFESDEFIPQNNGETPDCAKPITFRRSLSSLVGHYASLGGLPQFMVDVRTGSCTPETVHLHRAAMQDIRRAIRTGPVQYTSGHVFRYEPRGKLIVMDSDLWREFSELGHWIEPSVVVRWSEESERMSHRTVKASTVLDRLLVDVSGERDVGLARNVFESLSDKECVWSGKGIEKAFEVDHVIPFTLWHSNDLWNLLPCRREYNNAKRDKLPEHGLLIDRRDCIIWYWRHLRKRGEKRFDAEVQALLGNKVRAGNWETPTFSRLTEAVEITAVQRGVERWRP